MVCWDKAHLCRTGGRMLAQTGFCLSLKVKNFSLNLGMKTVVENPACSDSLFPTTVSSDSCLGKSFLNTMSITSFLQPFRRNSLGWSPANNYLAARISCKLEQGRLIFSCSYPRQMDKSCELIPRYFYSFRASLFIN